MVGIPAETPSANVAAFASLQAALGIAPFYLAGLDLTGATDSSAAILAALTAYGSVRLPPTGPGEYIKVSNNFIPPSGTKLLGAGMKTLDRTSQTWGGFGTLLVGSISCASRTDIVLADFAVDAVAAGGNLNGISGTTNGTRRIRVERVFTRSNNHGQLWEKNISDPGMTFGPNGSEVNDIIVVDCFTAASVAGTGNGFVSKMRGVRFIRCKAYDTLQAFVAVSDNINGATIYSRAQDVDFIECDGEGNTFVLRVYSRDAFSTANTNQVRGAKNIRWRGGAIRNAGQHGARIGDSAVGGQTLIANQGVWITDARITDNGLRGLIFNHLQDGGYDGCFFADNGLTSGLNQNVDWDIAGNVLGLVHGQNSYSAAPQGKETLLRPMATSASVFTCDLGVIFTNVGATARVDASLPAAETGRELSFYVRDADGFRIIAASGDTIRVGGSVSVAAGRIDSATIGSFVRLKCIDATEWVAMNVEGTWTVT